MTTYVYSLSANDTAVDLPDAILVNDSSDVVRFLERKFNAAALHSMNASIEDYSDEVHVSLVSVVDDENEEDEGDDYLEIFVSYQCDGAAEHNNLEGVIDVRE